MARDLKISNISDYVFDDGTTIFLNGFSLLDGISTPLTIDLENFILKKDEDRLKIEFTNYANEIITENVVSSSSLRKTVEALVEEEIAINVATETVPGSVCVFNVYCDNSTGVFGDIPITYGVDYINTELTKIKSETENDFYSRDNAFNRYTSSTNTKISELTSGLGNIRNQISSISSSVNSLNDSFNSITIRLDDIETHVARVTDFDDRINKIESDSLEALENQNNVFSKSIGTLTSNVISLDAKLNQSINTVSDLSQIVSDNSSHISNNETEISSLKEEISALKEKDENIEASLGAVNTKIQSQKTEIDSNYQILFSTLSETNNKIATLKSETLSKIQQSENRSKTYTDTSIEQNLKGYFDELSRVSSEVEILTSKLQSEKAEAYIDSNGTVYTNFETSFNLLAQKSKIEGIDGLSIKETLENINASIASDEARLTEMENALSNFNVSQTATNEELNGKILSIEETCNSEHTILTSRIDELVEKITNVECNYTGACTKIEELEAEIGALKSNLNTLNTEYQSLTQLSSIIAQNGMPMFADYFTEHDADVSSASISTAEHMFIKVPSPAGTRYYKVYLTPSGNSDDCILLEKPSPTMRLTLTGVAGQTVNLHEWFRTMGSQSYTNNQTPVYDFDIYWGDASEPEHITNDNVSTVSHTYDSSATGDIAVTMIGTCDYINGSSAGSTYVAPYLKKVEIINTSPLKYVCHPFKDCTLLESVSADIFDNCILAPNFSAAFKNCSSFKSIPSGIFKNCINNTSFHSTFFGCSSLAGPIPADLFSSASKVTAFDGLFSYCTGGLGVIPAGLFDKCIRATSFTQAFRGCSIEGDIPAGLFDKCPLLNNVHLAFYSATTGGKSINLPDGLFKNNPYITNLAQSFQGSGATGDCPNFAVSCKYVSSYGYCFNGCNMTSVGINLWSATSFGNAFLNNTNLRTLVLVDVTEGKLTSFIETALPNISGNSGTIYLKKTMDDATTTYTSEQEAAALALGWTIVDGGALETDAA